MNLLAVFFTGLLAGGVSCAAVQGGLLAGLVSRQKTTANETTSAARRAHRSQGTSSDAAVPTTTWRTQLGDDLAPVGGFLAGKLVSHTLAGGLLGALGTLLALSPHTRAVVQVLAGLLIIAFGLAQLEVRGFRSFTMTPPESWIRFVRGRARSSSAIAPAILGFASILVPCGVTLSVMALAMTSGSVWAGAATMAVFVLGTAPLFTVIGYAANKAATAWKGRLATATGVVVLISGLYALNGGLTLMDSPLAAKNLRTTFGGAPAIPDSSTVTVAGGQQTGVITVTPGRYSPSNLAIEAGVPTTLVFRSENARGCVAALVIPSLGVETVLPENGDSEVDLGTPKAGRIDYSCAMGMYSGTITIS